MFHHENSSILMEKYRPKTIKELVLPDKWRKYFENQLTNKDIDNIILYGKAGGGKTSTAFVLANELNVDVAYYNCSLQTSIDLVRGEIEEFCTTSSLLKTDAKFKKLVILDECLEENELIKTINSDGEVISKRIGDYKIGDTFDVVSFNMKTKEIENDVAEVIIDRTTDIYEVELEDGRIIRMSDNHPMLMLIDGNIVEKTIIDGLKVGDNILTI